MLLALLFAPLLAQSPITVRLNHERLSRGDHAKVYIETAQDGYLVVLHADPAGRVRVLFPLDPTDDAFVRGGRRQELRGRSNRDAFMVDGDDGAGTVLAAVSTDAFTFDGYVLNGHWDYRALGKGSVTSDPLAGLLDIVRQMSGESRFDYDVATYVLERDIAGYGHPYGYPRSPYDPFCFDPLWSWSIHCYGLGFGFGYRYGGFGYAFYPRSYGFGRTYIVGGFNRPRYVIPSRTTRERFTPIQPRSRPSAGQPSVAPRDRGGRGSGARPSISRGSSGGSRPAARPSGGRRSGSGGTRRN